MSFDKKDGLALGIIILWGLGVGERMKCPKCGEIHKLTFDGGFFRCNACGLFEWVKDWAKDKLRWGL